MLNWTEDARFDVFRICDVFLEPGDNHYLYVENEPFDYRGDYVCHEYVMCDDGTYVRYDTSCASGEYVSSLKPALWEMARQIVAYELDLYMQFERVLDKERDEDERMCEIVEDAKHSLLHYAEEGERFHYC